MPGFSICSFFSASLSNLQREQNMVASRALESGTCVCCSREPNYSVPEVPVLPQIPLMSSGPPLDLPTNLAYCLSLYALEKAVTSETDFHGISFNIILILVEYWN